MFFVLTGYPLNRLKLTNQTTPMYYNGSRFEILYSDLLEVYLREQVQNIE